MGTYPSLLLQSMPKTIQSIDPNSNTNTGDQHQQGGYKEEEDSGNNREEDNNNDDDNDDGIGDIDNEQPPAAVQFEEVEPPSPDHQALPIITQVPQSPSAHSSQSSPSSTATRNNSTTPPTSSPRTSPPPPKPPAGKSNQSSSTSLLQEDQKTDPQSSGSAAHPTKPTTEPAEDLFSPSAGKQPSHHRAEQNQSVPAKSKAEPQGPSKQSLSRTSSNKKSSTQEQGLQDKGRDLSELQGETPNLLSPLATSRRAGKQKQGKRVATRAANWPGVGKKSTTKKDLKLLSLARPANKSLSHNNTEEVVTNKSFPTKKKSTQKKKVRKMEKEPAEKMDQQSGHQMNTRGKKDDSSVLLKQAQSKLTTAEYKALLESARRRNDASDEHSYSEEEAVPGNNDDDNNSDGEDDGQGVEDLPDKTYVAPDTKKMSASGDPPGDGSDDSSSDDDSSSEDSDDDESSVPTDGCDEEGKGKEKEEEEEEEEDDEESNDDQSSSSKSNEEDNDDSNSTQSRFSGEEGDEEDQVQSVASKAKPPTASESQPPALTKESLTDSLLMNSVQIESIRPGLVQAIMDAIDGEPSDIAANPPTSRTYQPVKREDLTTHQLDALRMNEIMKCHSIVSRETEPAKYKAMMGKLLQFHKDNEGGDPYCGVALTVSGCKTAENTCAEKKHDNDTSGIKTRNLNLEHGISNIAPYQGCDPNVYASNYAVLPEPKQPTKPGTAYMVGFDNYKQGRWCNEHPNGCGRSIKQGDLVFVHGGLGLFIGPVKEPAIAWAVYSVEEGGKNLKCRIGNVITHVHDGDAVINRFAVVTKVVKKPTSDVFEDKSLADINKRGIEADKDGAALLTFLDDFCPIINPRSAVRTFGDIMSDNPKMIRKKSKEIEQSSTSKKRKGKSSDSGKSSDKYSKYNKKKKTSSPQDVSQKKKEKKNNANDADSANRTVPRTQKKRKQASVSTREVSGYPRPPPNPFGPPALFSSSTTNKRLKTADTSDFTKKKKKKKKQMLVQQSEGKPYPKKKSQVTKSSLVHNEKSRKKKDKRTPKGGSNAGT